MQVTRQAARIIKNICFYIVFLATASVIARVKYKWRYTYKTPQKETMTYCAPKIALSSSMDLHKLCKLINFNTAYIILNNIWTPDRVTKYFQRIPICKYNYKRKRIKESFSRRPQLPDKYGRDHTMIEIVPQFKGQR